MIELVDEKAEVAEAIRIVKEAMEKHYAERSAEVDRYQHDGVAIKAFQEMQRQQLRDEQTILSFQWICQRVGLGEGGNGV